MKIEDFSKLGKKVTNLSRISGLLKKLGNPQNSLKFVHIAGTNGKGSTLEFASQAVINSNYKVGQFTSPFNLHFEDRIRINGKCIPSKKVDELLEIVSKSIDNTDYSQFEVIFAIALMYFSEEKCDIIFLETGIGGLLDATNVVENVIISVITSISYDHMSILGNALEEIAYQKAGIIKENIPVIVSYSNPQNVINVISKVANKKNAPLYILNSNNYSEFLGDIDIKMQGAYQLENATTACKIIDILRETGFEISDKALRKALNEVQVPNRMEILSKKPLVIIDGAHNFSAMENLVSEIQKTHCKFTIIYGVLKDKEYLKMSEKLQEIAENVVFVDGFSPNSVKFNQISGLFSCPKYSCKSDKALEMAKKLSENILICGSLYLRSAIFPEDTQYL
jgi:dihydrofolate synthase/folylpolyglutamate synthase